MAQPLKLSLNVKHLMPDSKKFFVFQEMPKIDEGPASTVFTNVFLVNPAITGNPDGSTSASFTWNTQYYAVIGTISGNSNNVIKTSNSKPVTLGPNGSVIYMTGKDKGANWGPEADKQDFGGENGFKLVTDDKFEVDGANSPYIGVGTVDPNSGKVIPLQTFKAVPSLGSRFYPKLTYYVTVGNYEPGQFVDKKDVGKMMKIDYQFAQGDRVANLVYDVHGNWSQDPKSPSSTGIKLENSGVL